MRAFLLPVLMLAACDAPGASRGEPFEANDGASAAETGTAETYAEAGPAETPGREDAAADTTTPEEVEAAGDSGPVDADTPPSETGETSAAAPVILALSTNLQRITEGQSVTFSAVVTDPDGIDDLIGGTLRDPVSGGTYGVFATSAAEGAYQLTLSWAELHAMSPIELAAEDERVLLADFFDQGGLRTTREVRVGLHCDGSPACDGRCAEVRCEGECMELAVMARDELHCGGCGIACQQGAECANGHCACPQGWIACGGACVDPSGDPRHCGACDVACADGECSEGNCLCDETGACPGDEVCIPNGSWAIDMTCFELGEVRLLGGGSHDGDAQIAMDDEWIAVCQSSTGVPHVACRQLFGEGWTGIGAPTQDDSRVALHLTCDGSEAALAECDVVRTGGCPGVLEVTCEELPAAAPVTHLDVTSFVTLGAYAHYAIQVANGHSVVITTTAPNDVDLYARFGQPVAPGAFDLAAETTSGDETLVFHPSSNGTLHLAVFGYEASSFRLVSSEP